jgi:hypothetical protein
MTIGYSSAIIGGPTGYPKQLLQVSAGQIPNGTDAGFVFNYLGQSTFSFNKPSQVAIDNVSFLAKEVGMSSYNLLLGSYVQVLWNATFLKAELGSNLYSGTFGNASTANLAIIKVSSINEVSGVAAQIEAVMKPYPEYNVEYDSLTVTDLESVESSTAPMYMLLAGAALASMISAVFLVSYVSIGRRAWEAGLLVSLGWRWGRVRNFYLAYFLMLAAVSYAFAALLSFILVSQFSSSYIVYGGYLAVLPSLDPMYLSLAAISSVLLVVAASQFMVFRLRKVGVESALREF